MSDINREQFRIALPDGGLERSAKGIVLSTGFPTRPYRPFANFDSTACAIKDAKPDDPRVVAVVKTTVFSPDRIIMGITGGKIDFGIVPVAALPDPSTPNFERLKGVYLWDEENGVKIPSELVSDRTFDREIMEAETLRGIPSLRERLVVKLLRACDETTQATDEAEKRKIREDAWRTQEDNESSSSFWRFY